MFEIDRYSTGNQTEWNQFVAASKNGTFLFCRNYMDYHSSRFCDHSLLFRREGVLYAIMPANAEDGVFFSHRGLTYGGLLINEQATAACVVQLFRELNDYLHRQGFTKVIYKPVPHIFHLIPSEEDLYALFSVCNAKLKCRNVSSSIDFGQPLKWHRDRKYGVNKALRHGTFVGESNDWSGFWEVLQQNLLQKYDAHPVHSIEEIQLLHSRFPKNIRLFTASYEGRILGGTVIYCTPMVTHAQYISASPEGKQLRVIDALFDHLIHHCEWPSRYFDFGTSNEDGGRTLVEPLIYQKEGFGGRAICYDTYEWTL